MCVPAGNPSPPENLNSTANTTSLNSITIMWEPPQHQQEGIVTYIIKIPSINYVVKHNSTFHRISTAVGSGMEFYDVEVTAVTQCGYVSKPANLTLRILATGKGLLYVLKYIIHFQLILTL